MPYQATFARSTTEMMGYANVAITDAEVFEGPTGVVGMLTGMLAAHTGRRGGRHPSAPHHPRQFGLRPSVKPATPSRKSELE